MRVLLIAVLSLLPLAPLALHAAERPPDIVVILTDDMRADDWRVLEDTQRLVGGTMFPNFIYTTPLCCPTRATLHSGLYAHNHGVYVNNPGWPEFRAEERDALAPALDRVGYHTAYIGKYLNGYTGNQAPPGWDDWKGVNTKPKTGYFVKAGYVTDVYRDRALASIRDAPKEYPLFLMVGFFAPHAPWKPAPKYAHANVGATINRADADRKRTLHSVDDAVEAIAAEMGPRWDNACVLVLTDNGYLLGEHGTTGKSIWWDQAQRVPLLIRCSGITGQTDTRLAASVDIAPTILAAAGASMNHGTDGRPLQEVWNREGVLIESWDYTEASKNFTKRIPYRGIKGADWVYVVPKGKPPRYYLLEDREKINHISTLSLDERQRLASWLADLRDCAGADCWQSPP